jgi:DNA-binding LacI/PurR family transcriptional regulator
MVTNAESAVSEMLGDALRGGSEEAFYFGGQPHLSPSIDRLRGFRSALAKAGLDEQPEWVTARDYRRRAAELARQSAANGLELPTKVLETEADLRKADSDWLGATLQRHVALLRLHALTGSL